ncbi:ferrous iron transport protein B [Clostridium pasteurianum DSM 525 = ATCC 6013]|uniref:Ferrous iron transport protein B n=1 Tax=Clostridium pasteurianum DSM 525 = ATCC 6013 TaxID=1262449 RepID=A0A0H3J002_CLOPA|nr:ferrous iron transport protein B [Clostridium pasteurianum]AJA46634.1 ferrous iron transport protein B [Clostridium pasteurianum DSM 525 = ATCC 6013]AJA50622.1 ferrous iron transport protein B [Clostridium pasteurianum DSM 525 = ATCC 6013]AOZ74047.1 iron transporter FeoB [Clostridium pasteurianum DSM 525 = ATCC 6013]AOZ77844.1 iron transporter FeoB [Clostridium pasteurianum]ELP61200.1 ferrous iron transport protein B [Clostridium pasteurianum DSM 525 = ATCC 6013]
MSIKIALAGNPNSGKTTMFNDLTGSSQYVGNWPGVTVEKKEGKLKGHKDVIIQDLPGIYSLSPYTLEEVVSRNYLINEKPDAIINIIDGTNIERNLYLSTQLVEIGIPVVMAVNMIDVVRKNGDTIDLKKLKETLGCEVVETSALKGIGSKEVAQKAIELAKAKNIFSSIHTFSKDVEDALTKIQDVIQNHINNLNLRWVAIKLFERDEKIHEQLSLSSDLKEKINSIIEVYEEKLDDDGESIITNERYLYISKVIKQAVHKKYRGKHTTSDKIDGIVTNRWLGLPIFAGVMFLVYYLAVSSIGSIGTDWVNDVLFGEIVPNAVGNFLTAIGTAEWLNSLILDGIVAGVGAVLGFLPQMLVLFFCLSILEDCGYMARIAFIMDRIFRKFGLSGKSFIPILIGTGCGVPGIMSTRTIENQHDRRMTIIVTTFIPCGAKLPIIALIAGALFPGSVWVAPSAYFVGIAAIIISGIMLKKTKLFSGTPAPFVMELPTYHIPGIKNVLIHMWDRSKHFVQKAGTVILLATVGVWFLSTFSWNLAMVDAEDSILASIGRVIAVIFAPLGWGNWRAAVATITGLIAKENVVGTFGILYGFAEVAEDGAEVWGTLHASFTQVAAYSFLVFNLLCAPCFAAIGAVRNEMGSAKWTWFAIGYQTVFAYAVALIINQVGSLVTGGSFGFGTVVAFALILVLIYLLFRKPSKTSHNEIGNSIDSEKEAVM